MKERSHKHLARKKENYPFLVILIKLLGHIGEKVNLKMQFMGFLTSVGEDGSRPLQREGRQLLEHQTIKTRTCI